MIDCLECKSCSLPEGHNENCDCGCFTGEAPKRHKPCAAALAVKGETYGCDNTGQHDVHGNTSAGAIWQAGP